MVIELKSYLSYPKKWIESEARRVNNGCGPDGWKGDIIPDKIFGVSLKAACLIHDWEYYIGKTKKDKKRADKRFRKNIIKLFKKEYKGNMSFWKLRVIAWVYYWGVRAAGDEYFD